MNRRINTNPLTKWASVGRQLRSANQKAVPSWLSVQKLIDATQPILQENRNEARRLLEASNRLFAPLKDPFETPLGLHRWLSGGREEAYSDWFAWIIEQLATPETIAPLLCGGSASDLVKQCAGPLTVHRETIFVTAESLRRTDIEIYFGHKRAILVEVKMIEADKVDEEQLYDQAHYGADFEKRLLLVPSGEVGTVSADFDLILWRDVCLRLRRLVPSICRKNVSIAAMVLAFVGAVEQNLLNLPTKHEWYLVTSSTLDYLRQSLEGDIADA
jgi:hypothetical protein